jgi:hypothetical protein
VDPASSAMAMNAARNFLGLLIELENAYNAEGYFPDESRVKFDQAVALSRSYFTQMLIVTAVPSHSPRLPWSLGAVWPNPASDNARVVYQVPAGGGAHDISVYDAGGRTVRRLYSGSRAAGSYELDWDGRDGHGARVASGVYFIRIQPHNAPAVARKLLIVR